MLTLLHAADFHLDSPFRALPPQEAQRRRQGQRETLDALRDLALEHRVDLVLLPGDLVDSQETYPETLEALSRALGQMPCPVVIAPGNHDYYDPKSPYARMSWPDNVHIFQHEAVTSFSFPELGVTVYGCAFTGPFRETDPLAGFHAPGDGTLAIGCLHGDVGKRSRYAPIAPESLAQSGLAYAALGHFHGHTGVDSDLPTPWAYPGCLQGRGFDEVGPKGCYLIRLQDDRSVSCRFCPLPGPRYWVMIHPGAPDLSEILPLMEHWKDGYVRLVFTGEAEPFDLPALRARLEPLCRVLELRDETVPPLDLWARLQEESLTGYFLREMKSRLDAAEETDKDLLQAALRCGLAALEGRETPQW